MNQAHPVLIVQQIKTYWTKKSRGNPGASRRNSVPEAVPISMLLPSKHKARPKIVYHMVEYNEHTNFQPTEHYLIDPSVYPYYGCTTVTHTNSHIHIIYTYQRAKGGAPDRYHKTRTLTAQYSQWAQIIENGRFSPAWEGEWWYQKVVTNAALTPIFDPTIFTSKPPAESYVSLEELW